MMRLCASTAQRRSRSRAVVSHWQRSVRVARRDVARDLRAFVEVALDRELGGRRAGAVGLLEAAVAAVEAGDQPFAPVTAGRFGIDQRLHLVAPGLTFARPAQVAQVMQRAE